MPTIIEEASQQQRERAYGLKSPPLPRLSPQLPNISLPNTLTDNARYEVVVIGTGPSGMLFSYLLSYYGLSSVLSLEKSTAEILPGQADGLQPRTLEVLSSLKLLPEILEQGFHSHLIAFWNTSKDPEKRIERTAVAKDVVVKSRYQFKIGLAAGRIVNIIERAMNRYGGNVERGVVFEDFEILPGEEEFPVKVTVRNTVTNTTSTIRTKYLVGADGAHSAVRRSMGVILHGESTDAIFGVADVVFNTDFPDVRRRSVIHSPDGSIILVPREMIEGYRSLTRVYIQMDSEVEGTSSGDGDAEEKERARERRKGVTLSRILERIKETLQPYKGDVEHVDWWAAYQIGQRVAEKFAVKDEKGQERVFIMGDACHTHSPKAGQGMNISMMDAYNLAWKLVHVVNGLALPNLLSTYEIERRAVAQQLIDFDKQWAKKFSQKIADEEGSSRGLTHEKFVDGYHASAGFTSGCAVQYDPTTPLTSILTTTTCSSLRPENQRELIVGRRLMNARIRYFASDTPVDLHDALPSNHGVYTILAFLPEDYRTNSGFWNLLESLLSLMEVFVATEPLVLYSETEDSELDKTWEWFPESLRQRWEWQVCCGSSTKDESDLNSRVDAYEVLGIAREKGVVGVIRPDGIVGGVWSWNEAVREVEKYLERVVQKGENFC